MRRSRWSQVGVEEVLLGDVLVGEAGGRRLGGVRRFVSSMYPWIGSEIRLTATKRRVRTWVRASGPRSRRRPRADVARPVAGPDAHAVRVPRVRGRSRSARSRSCLRRDRPRAAVVDPDLDVERAESGGVRLEDRVGAVPRPGGVDPLVDTPSMYGPGIGQVARLGEDQRAERLVVARAVGEADADVVVRRAHHQLPVRRARLPEPEQVVDRGLVPRFARVYPMSSP